MTCSKSQSKLVLNLRVDSNYLGSYLVPSSFHIPKGSSIMKQPAMKCNHILGRTKCGVQELSITCEGVGDIQL